MKNFLENIGMNKIKEAYHILGLLVMHISWEGGGGGGGLDV